MATARRAVDLARTLRSSAGLKLRQPLARLWLALPGGELAERDALLALIAEEVNVREVELIGDDSDLVDRRVKPLLPKVGPRLGASIPRVMAAARAGDFTIRPDGGVDLAGVSLAADEVEILATPRPGTAVAHDEGLVVVIDTVLNPELLAEGDARELQRAIQDLRREAELALDDRIVVWLEPRPATLDPYLEAVAVETLADGILAGPATAGASSTEVELDAGTIRLALRRVAGDG
jgi:isoleucyl-tRNA synthetase